MRKARAGIPMMLGLGLVVAGCGGATQADAAPGARVLASEDVERVELGEVAEGIPITGSLDPYRVVEVRAKLAGTVVRVLRDRGTVVRSGEVLAVYESAAGRAGRGGAVAAGGAAESALASADHGATSAETLFAAGAISETELRRSRSALAAARSGLAAARAELASAEEVAGDAVVTSPLAGYLSVRAVDPGEAVRPGQALFEVVDIDTLELVAKVPVGRLGSFGPGSEVRFHLDGVGGHERRGWVDRVDPVADAATRQATVYIRLPNTTGELIAGIYATGRILTRTARAAATVPVAALQEGADGAWVLAVDGDDRLERVGVTVLARDPGSGRVAVDGIKPGTRVVRAAPDRLEPGTLVVIQTRDGEVIS